MMGLQYREQLQSLRYTERERNGQLVASSAGKRQRELAIYREEQFAVLSYLLRILHSLPHELIGKYHWGSDVFFSPPQSPESDGEVSQC